MRLTYRLPSPLALTDGEVFWPRQDLLLHLSRTILLCMSERSLYFACRARGRLDVRRRFGGIIRLAPHKPEARGALQVE